MASIKGKLYLKPKCKNGRKSGKTWALFVLMNENGHQYHCLVFGELAERAERDLTKCAYDAMIEVLGKVEPGEEPETTKVFVDNFRLESGEEFTVTERDRAIKRAGGVEAYQREIKEHYQQLIKSGLRPVSMGSKIVWEPERALVYVDGKYHKPLELACDVLGDKKVSDLLIEGGASTAFSNVRKSRKVIREIVELALADLNVKTIKWGKDYE